MLEHLPKSKFDAMAPSFLFHHSFTPQGKLLRALGQSHLVVLLEAEFSNDCLHQGLRSNSKMEVCQCCRHLPLSPCCNIVSHHLALHSLQMQHLMVSSFPSSLFSPISCLQSFNQTPIPSQLNNQEKAEPTDQRLSGNITNLS